MRCSYCIELYMKHSNIIYSLQSAKMCFDSSKFVKNYNFNSCKNCKFFIPDTYYYDFTWEFNKYNKFGVKNIVSDKIDFDYAKSCRNDDSKCGVEGKFFEKEPNLYSKVIIHKIRTPQFKFFFLSGVWFFFYIHTKICKRYNSYFIIIFI